MNNDAGTRVACEKKPPKCLGLAIVGCGQIVTHHVEALSAKIGSETVIVRALCDPSVDRRAIIRELPFVRAHRAHSAVTESSIVECNSLEELITRHRDLLDERIDIIFIAVPHDLHESLANLAVRETKATVVMEKPLAPTRCACERLVQLSSKNKGRLYIAEQSPYWQEVVKAKLLISQGAIGTVVSASSYYYESMRDNLTSGSVEATGGLGWRGSLARAGGGIAMDGGLHWLRPIRELCGNITNVVGIIRPHLVPQLEMEGEALGHALLEIDTLNRPYLQQPDGSGPLTATYSCNMLATAPMAHDSCPYIRITGNGGELIIHGTGLAKAKPGAGGLRLYNPTHPAGAEQFPNDRIGGFFLGFTGLWAEIFRIMDHQDSNAAHGSVVQAAADVRVVLALYRSARTRQWEKP